MNYLPFNQTKMEWKIYALTIVPLVIMHVAGVEATNNSDVIGIAVAGCVSFVLLSVIIALLVMAWNWTMWFNGCMKQRGKVRMPKAYFQKKEEAKRRLISSSLSSAVPVANGNLPPQNVDRDVPEATMVQGWRQRNTGFINRIYEEKDAVLELGEEGDDEFKIEAEIVDNEVLDVGPFKHDHSQEVPVQGNVYPNPYIYSSVDISKSVKATANGSVKPDGAIATSSGKSKGTKNQDSDYSTPNEVKRDLEESVLYY